MVLQQLANSGFKRVVITLGHMAPIFKAHLGDGERFGMDISYVIEDDPLGTAGSVRLVEDLEDDFLIMNGDLLTTLDYGALLKFHKREQGSRNHLAPEEAGEYRLRSDSQPEDGKLSEYEEKPTIPYEVSMGVNALSKKCLDFIPTNGKYDMPQLMLDMRTAGNTVMCFRPDCYWKDIGRFDDFQEASADFDANPDRFLKPN